MQYVNCFTIKKLYPYIVIFSSSTERHVILTYFKKKSIKQRASCQMTQDIPDTFFNDEKINYEIYIAYYKQLRDINVS